MTVPVGSIILFAGSVAPSDWMFCEGGKVDGHTHPALAKVFATMFNSSIDGMLTLPTLGDFGSAKHIIRVR